MIQNAIAAIARTKIHHLGSGLAGLGRGAY